jgi:ubiquinone biosynthesis protein
VKFGQVLSTRRDLLPLDIADELAKLQDRVPPFPSTRRLRTRSSAVSAAASTRCSRLRAEPVASASIAQVHFARCCPTAARSRSRCCAPAWSEVIDRDLALLEPAAGLVERLWPTAGG